MKTQTTWTPPGFEYLTASVEPSDPDRRYLIPFIIIMRHCDKTAGRVFAFGGGFTVSRSRASARLGPCYFLLTYLFLYGTYYVTKISSLSEEGDKCAWAPACRGSLDCHPRKARNHKRWTRHLASYRTCHCHSTMKFLKSSLLLNMLDKSQKIYFLPSRALHGDLKIMAGHTFKRAAVVSDLT